jgi:hypothetical protein
MHLKCFSVFLFVALSAGIPSGDHLPSEPPAPTLQWLYTSFVELGIPIDVGEAPNGRRVIFPITGGNFSGPKMSGMHNMVLIRSSCLISPGKINNLGGDWAQIINGTTYTDTRYNLVTTDGGQIYVRSEGATDEATGNLPGKFKLETGHSRYQWLNKATGKLTLLFFFCYGKLSTLQL